MNKILLYIICSISIVAKAQVKTRYYLDNIDTVEYLTLNFCVDSIGKTSKVSLVKDKSTFKDQDIITKIVAYRKSIEYFENTKLKNNCYDQTFEFINSKYEKKTTTSEDCKNFKKVFRKGNFQYFDPRYKDVKIKRRKNKQIEKSKDSKLVFKIDWISDYEYNLTYLKVSKKEYEYLIGEVINVKVLEILENGNYIYKSNLLDRTSVIGEMKKL